MPYLQSSTINQRIETVKADYNFVVDRLERGLWDDRIKACKVLADSGDPRAWEPLTRALHDHELEVREAACRGLLKILDRRTIDPLITFLNEESDAPLRRLVIEGLAQLKAGEAEVVLTQCLADPDVGVRVAASNALGEIGIAASAGALIKVLNDASRYVRATAAEALGRLKKRRAIRPLIALLGDSEPAVRQNVLEALRRLGEEPLVEAYKWALQASSPDASALARLASRGDVRIVTPLLRRLEDGWLREDTREKISDTLEALHPAAISRLKTLFCTKHFARFEDRTIEAGNGRIRHVGCRTCGSTLHVISVDAVRAVLDEKMNHRVQFSRGLLRVKWSAGNALFDFNEVEVGTMDDKVVAQFCVQVANDTEPFRRRLYDSTKFHVKPTSNISENTRQMLERTFGG